MIGLPVNGSSTIFAELYLNVSVPIMTLAGYHGKPMAAALNLHWKAALLSSPTNLTRPDSVALLDSELDNPTLGLGKNLDVALGLESCREPERRLDGAALEDNDIYRNRFFGTVLVVRRALGPGSIVAPSTRTRGEGEK